MRSDAGGNPCCNGVVSSKNQWEEALAQRLLGGLGNVETGFRDLLQVFFTLLANGHFLRLLHLQVADVFFRVAKVFDCRLPNGPPPSRGGGPMSTRRRDWRRSRGTQMMRTFCGMALSRFGDQTVCPVGEAYPGAPPFSGQSLLPTRKAKDTPCKSCAGRG